MADKTPPPGRRRWLSFAKQGSSSSSSDSQEPPREKRVAEKWSMGILNDKRTIEVPGSVLLLAPDRNEPLGLRNAPARTSASSIPIGIPDVVPQPPPPPPPPLSAEEQKKKTRDGKIILDPQPDDSANDPLNWPTWRRDSALLSLGLYCMVGGGMTPLLAAGFTNVAHDYHIDVSRVSLTTGLYMTGLGVGSVIFSPTAILYGKRPVYLFSAVLFILSSVWCALSPNFPSLILARIFQGIAVSPVECLPSATIAEIYFLHERAFRIGIYTLLLLGGKNLVPLASAAVIQRLGWRWVFWVVAFVVAFCGVLLFLFVPETFWDRRPTRKPKHHQRPNFFRRFSSRHDHLGAALPKVHPPPDTSGAHNDPPPSPGLAQRQQKKGHVGFATESEQLNERDTVGNPNTAEAKDTSSTTNPAADTSEGQHVGPTQVSEGITPAPGHQDSSAVPTNTPTAVDNRAGPETPDSPAMRLTLPSRSYSATSFSSGRATPRNIDLERAGSWSQRLRADGPASPGETDSEKLSISSALPSGLAYTAALRDQPPLSFTQQLKIFHGRLHKDRWYKVAIRPLILFLYPSVLWSSVVYSCSIGWLIVLSESVAVIYRDADSYNFSALQTGLVYISPFVGGILGTAVAGRVSDVVVKRMAARNGGLYEPEFRLVMAAPIAATTVIGLMGFGWSAQERDRWIVPTIFFGIVSFGCSLGSTTSITFCVDSYRQYAGEALVTLNFSKNIFHGLVFSLFVTGWITSDGPKMVFIWIGVIQLVLLVFTIPMYIFGKRARMWTVRKNFMEKF